MNRKIKIYSLTVAIEKYYCKIACLILTAHIHKCKNFLSTLIQTARHAMIDHEPGCGGKGGKNNRTREFELGWTEGKSTKNSNH